MENSGTLIKTLGLQRLAEMVAPLCRSDSQLAGGMGVSSMCYPP